MIRHLHLREHLDKEQSSRNGAAAELRAGAVMVNDAISYFGIAECAARRVWRERLGPHAWEGRAARMVQMKYIDVDGLPGTKALVVSLRFGSGARRRCFFCNLNSPAVSARSCENARSAMKTFFRDHGFREGLHA